VSRHPDFVEAWYPEKRFGGFTNVDGTVAFYSRINAVVDGSSIVLDLGCGRGAAAEDPVPWRRHLQTLRGRCARVIGADVDAAAAANPLIDEFHLIVDGRLPLGDESIDVCYSDYVLEHVEDVDAFFAECARVLKPGGHLFIRTPNMWSYMGVASRLVPDRLHARVLHRIQPGRRKDDVYPTVYRCNSRRKLQRALEKHGFVSVVQTHDAEPAYLAFSRVLYILGVLHQRYAPRAMRQTLFAFATKQSRSNSPHPSSHFAERPARTV
jgi:SAM-dependent methyltransferase